MVAAAEMPRATQQTSPLVHGLKLSSVVPAKMTGDNRARELSGMDLAVKLHYLRGVYFFRAPDAPVGIDCLKEPMFRWLELCYPVTGQIRRHVDGGRPFVKCNDSGVRIVEAMSEKTVDEWHEMEDHAEIDDKVLVYDHALGPDLGFSPLVFVQFTWFKCGGISIGLSWAHVLGDAFCASSFLNMWGLIMAGHVPTKSLHVPDRKNLGWPPGAGSGKVSSLRQVDPVGDYWIAANDRKMRTRSVQITGDRLDHLMASHGKCSSFHVLSAVIWKSLAKIQGEGRVRVVTICTGSYQGEVDRCLPGNHMIVGTVEAGFPVSEASVSELATWVAERKVDESREIEETVDSEVGKSDYILYGANVTLVNLEDANIYGLELKGEKPTHANYTINGVGDEGTILILPWPGNGKEGNGMRVTMILPGTEVSELEKELRTNWGFL